MDARARRQSDHTRLLLGADHRELPLAAAAVRRGGRGRHVGRHVHGGHAANVDELVALRLHNRRHARRVARDRSWRGFLAIAEQPRRTLVAFGGRRGSRRRGRIGAAAAAARRLRRIFPLLAGRCNENTFRIQKRHAENVALQPEHSTCKHSNKCKVLYTFTVLIRVLEKGGEENLPDGKRSTGDEARGSANVILITMTEPMLVPAHRLGFAVDSGNEMDQPKWMASNVGQGNSFRNHTNV